MEMRTLVLGCNLVGVRHLQVIKQVIKQVISKGTWRKKAGDAGDSRARSIVGIKGYHAND